MRKDPHLLRPLRRLQFEAERGALWRTLFQDQLWDLAAWKGVPKPAYLCGQEMSPLGAAFLEVLVAFMLALLAILDFLLGFLWTLMVIRTTVELVWAILCWLYYISYHVLFS